MLSSSNSPTSCRCKSARASAEPLVLIVAQFEGEDEARRRGGMRCTRRIILLNND